MVETQDLQSTLRLHCMAFTFFYQLVRFDLRRRAWFFYLIGFDSFVIIIWVCFALVWTFFVIFYWCLKLKYSLQKPADPPSDLEQESRRLEWKLRQQQRQSEEDSRWLAEEESHLV